jgi:potassium uptake Trk family protein
MADLWIISLTILGSILIFSTGRGDLAYIDALFFASGANTQAGLNTVDVNLLNTTQQVIIYFLSMMSSPITINSFVVFLRLYWFEKRFQHVVREARLRRSTISKSKSKQKAKGEPASLERGVNGRHITVMHGGAKSRITNDGILLDPAQDKPAEKDDGLGIHQNGNDHKTVDGEGLEGRRPEIKFANTVRRSDGMEDETTQLPQMRSDEDHIAILERQRRGDDEVLRIPGPRDADRGALPERIKQGDDDLEPMSPGVRQESRDEGQIDLPARSEVRHQAITIEEPDRRHLEDSSSDMADDARAFAKTLSFLRLRRPRIFNRKDRKLHREENQIHITGQRPKRRPTFENMRSALSREKDLGTPYLSWEPTLGRNSQFPDLTEEQREELGGIEYRSLKTLALILVLYFWGFTVLGVVLLLPWIINDSTYGPIVDSAGQSRVWWGIFTPNSAFMDLGFTLTPDSMNSFNTATYPLIFMSFFIVIGNTGFPVMLRFLIWVASRFVPVATGLWEELKFLLDHPRRCFTLLFPSAATWWLFWLLVILNGIDLIFFIILDVSARILAMVHLMLLTLCFVRSSLEPGQ